MALQAVRDRAVWVSVLFFFIIVHLGIFVLREIWAELLDSPIEDEVELELTLVVEFAEETAKVGVVGLLLKAQVAAVVHVGGHLFWVAQTERLNWSVHLALLDLLVLFLFVHSSQVLPRQLAFK